MTDSVRRCAAGECLPLASPRSSTGHIALDGLGQPLGLPADEVEEPILEGSVVADVA